jgi:hypothetical protein
MLRLGLGMNRNRKSRNIVRSVNDGQAEPNAVFKAVLIYENVTAGARARCCLERLARESGKALQEQMWNFDVLGIREARNGAASAARKADVVAVSASGQLEFPGAVRAWFDMWLWLLEDENPALLALFDSSATLRVGSVHPYLSRIAQRAGIEFFSANRQVSLFPVVRPKEDAIWPESVERALLSWLKSRGRGKRSIGHRGDAKCCQLEKPIYLPETCSRSKRC